MKLEDAPQIIEVIDDDVDAFGERGRSSTIHDTGGPRWVGPAAAVALAALIGYGIATSSSSNGPPSAAPVVSTTAPPPTTVAAKKPAIPVQQPPVPYYAADLPRQYTIQDATIQRLDVGLSPGGDYQLWATNGAAATTGAWFSIQTYTGAGQGVAVDAYRVQTDRHSIGISHTRAGHTVAQFSDDGSEGVLLTSFGLVDDTVVRLAGAIDVRGQTIEITDTSVLAGFSLQARVPPWFIVQGVPLEYVTYTPGNDVAAAVVVSVSRRPSSGAGADDDRATAQRFYLDDATPFTTVDRHAGVAGTLVGQVDSSIASWTDGNHIVAVTATMPLAQLIGIARTVHQVSEDEWRGMQFQATRHSRDNNFGAFDQTTPAQVALGTDANGDTWTVNVSVASFISTKRVAWQWSGGNGYESELDASPRISTVVDGDRTYVLADLPKALSAAATLQITRAGLDPVAVDFIDADPALDRTFAAYAFTEAAPYTAQVIDQQGSTLAAWPTS